MNNTALAIISALFIIVGSWLLSAYTSCGASGTTNSTQFSILDGELKTNPMDPITFGLSGIIPTMNDATGTELKKVVEHLKANEDRTLNIVGNYYSSEKGDSDLGLARADAIKAKMERMGAPEGSITTSSQRLSTAHTGDKIYNSVNWVFSEKKTEEVSEVIEEVRSVLDPFTVRFPTGVAKPSMTTELRTYLDEALNYMENNPGAVLMVSGHTDNEGSSSSNLRLSKKRAEIVRRLLRNSGVGSKQVKYQGKGDAEPVADNDTDEGKEMNRRVEIQLITS